MKKLFLLPIFVLVLGLTGCPKAEQNARDAAAALGGAIQAAQIQYQVTCKAEPLGSACVTINKAVAAQNALITATEAYCGWAPGTAIAQTSCTPVASAQAALTAAINNANLFVIELKGVIQ